MKSIQESAYPLCFKTARPSGIAPAVAQGRLFVRSFAAALEGMQKQALIASAHDDAVWNMVCDEGPYLNGTDLAPFPLAFFTTGMATSIVMELEALIRRRALNAGAMRLTLDNTYTMEGSALRGTMVGGALPVCVEVETEHDIGRAVMADLVSQSLQASPAIGLLRDELVSRFALTHNKASLAPGRVAGVQPATSAAPFDLLAMAAPTRSDCYADGIIRKLSSADSVFGVEGGAGSSLAAEQKRQLHVRGIAERRADGLLALQVQLFKPIGSVFHFLADASPAFGGSGRAPSGLAYLSAGIAFCFLTQLGRFAHIAKQQLDSYGIVQDIRFDSPGISAGTGKPAGAKPVDTHVHVESPESVESIRHLVDMGEQTCFLHAACRTPLKPRMRLRDRREQAA